MQYSEAKQGRVFTLRLEDGEIIHEIIERFAKEKNIRSAYVQLLGGADKGSKLIVGPKDGRAEKIEPMEYALTDVYEVAGVGTLFPDEDGAVILHLHLSAGRNIISHTGCIRNGVKVWHVLEVVIVELLGSSGIRKTDKETGFKLLRFD
jgi:predicted DNA-binding protein with PD1-like motif